MNDCGNLPANETDNDGDGYVECILTPQAGGSSQVDGGGDCLDSDATTYPAAASAESSTDYARCRF